MKFTLYLGIFCTLILTTRSIFVNENGTESISLEALNGLDMSDAQKILSLENFNNLTTDSLDSVEIRPLNIQTPGDVLGQGLLPKSAHLLERTPNLRVVTDNAANVTTDRVRIERPTQVISSIPSVRLFDRNVIEQPEFVMQDVNVEMPAINLPQFTTDESGEICLPEVEPINLPQITMPGSITASLPQVQLAQIDAEMPNIQLQNQQIDLPSVDVQRVNAELPQITVEGVEASEFPDVQVPGVDAELPNIELPSEQNVDMPRVEVPALNQDMPNINVPSQINVDLPDVNLPNLNTDLPNLNLEFAAQPALPDFDVPAPQTTLPSFNRASTINVDVPAIAIPQLNIRQAPQIADVNINASMPNIRSQAFAARPDDIRTRRIEGVVVPNIVGRGAGINIPNFAMRGAAAVVPTVPIPKVSVNLPTPRAGRAVEVRRRTIPIPQVNFPMPSMNTFRVQMPSIPNIVICPPEERQQLFTGNPEVENTLIQEGSENEVTVPQVEVEEEPENRFVMVTRDVAERLGLQIRTREQVETELRRQEEERQRREEEARQRLENAQTDRLTLRKFFRNNELPNEVARAFGVLRSDVIPQTDLSEIDFVGSSGH